MELLGKNIVVYDCEIKKAFVTQPGVYKSGFTREEFLDMGVSTACLFDYRTGDYSVYLDDNLSKLPERLNSADLVVGFNILGFDNPLIEHTTGQLLTAKPYDMLYYSRRSTGWKTGDRFPSGLRLDNHLEAMFGDQFKKTEDAAQAPAMFQRGELGRVISYCLADVHREKTLFEHMWKNGNVKTQTHGLRDVIRPQQVLDSDASVALL